MKIGLIGNQNSGKTTLFNCLTGMNAKIGNWPGVTIEKKTGIIKGPRHEIVDLPGIYSLSPYTVEEKVSKNFIFDEKPDVIINIVDATSLERSLYLTTQLLELDCKVVVALNMSDILEKKGLNIDIEKLSKTLGAKVVKISALKETGIEELKNALDEDYNIEHRTIFDEKIENAVKNIETILGNKLLHKRFISVKILENDEDFKKYNKQSINKIVSEIKNSYDMDLEEVIATQRYTYIEEVKRSTIKQKKTKVLISDSLDRIFLNKWLAFPIFIIIMFLVYYLSVGIVGSFTVDFIAGIFETFGKFISNLLINIGTSEWLVSLVADGILAGVGAVLGFVPQLALLFLCISILETTGYMSRISFLLDRAFKRIGLSGKSLIPFIIGTGCSVPGIMGSRIIENEEERKMTTILTPFIPCSAKLPIIALFSGYFFPKNSGLVSASLYFFAIIVIVLSAFLMKKIIFKNISNTYIFELPDYKLPSFKYVTKDVFSKVTSFIKRAGTIILACSIVIWFLLSFSFSMKYGVNIHDSILATIGNKISWIFYPMLGTNSWGATVSAIQGLVAKEQVVSSMAVIAGLAESTEEGGIIFASSDVFIFFTPASAYAFMVFNLFSAPCFGAIGAMRRELGGNKSTLKAISFQTGLAWLLATIVYQIGSRVDSIASNLANILIICSIILILTFIVISNIKNKNLKCAYCPYCDECNKKQV